MANRNTGNSTYVVDGKTYQLKLDSNAMIAMEEAASRPDRMRFFNDVLSLTGRVAAASDDVQRRDALARLTDAVLGERENARTEHMRVMTFPEVMSLAQSGSWKYQRILVWASLQKHHPDVTLEQAGEIMLESAEMEMATTIADLAKSSTPDPKDVAALGVKPNPPEAQPKKRGRKPKAGIGTASTDTAGASV